jgi:hypothetical protein
MMVISRKNYKPREKIPKGTRGITIRCSFIHPFWRQSFPAKLRIPEGSRDLKFEAISSSISRIIAGFYILENI